MADKRKRTPWEKLSQASRARAQRAGVTATGYRAGAWVPWSRQPKPTTKYARAKQSSLNRTGLTPAQLRPIPPKNRQEMQLARARYGADFSWLAKVPTPVRAQAYRRWRDTPPGQTRPTWSAADQATYDRIKRRAPWAADKASDYANYIYARKKLPPGASEADIMAYTQDIIASQGGGKIRGREFYATKSAFRFYLGDEMPDWWLYYH